jgi:hypothetical protein
MIAAAATRAGVDCRRKRGPRHSVATGHERFRNFVIGPIEWYDDRLYGHKASHAALVLIKDLT